MPANVRLNDGGVGWNYGLPLFYVVAGLGLWHGGIVAPFGEIDLIVQKNNTLQFIEVKYRSSVDDPAAALPSFSSRKRLHRAARYFIMKHPQSDDMEQNFHIVLVTKTLRLQWFDNVFIDFD